MANQYSLSAGGVVGLYDLDCSEFEIVDLESDDLLDAGVCGIEIFHKIFCCCASLGTIRGLNIDNNNGLD